jgi:tripartite-type tricarboxylate transporter receptor subunit TctC
MVLTMPKQENLMVPNVSRFLRLGSQRIGAAIATTAALVLGVVAPPAHAQAFPAKPVRIVVPYAAAGPTDIIARVVAQKMSEDLGQTVLIENRPGAATRLGSELVSRAPKDGYTLLLATTSTFSTNPHIYKKLNYSIEDFLPVALLGKTAWVVAVNNDLPVRSIGEFVAYAKARQGQLNYGMMGIGSSSQFVGKMLEGATGISMVDVAYKGTGPALTDLMAGQVQVYVDAISTSMPLHRAGKARVIGVMAEKRAAVAADVPTFVEAGYPGRNAHCRCRATQRLGERCTPKRRSPVTFRRERYGD